MMKKAMVCIFVCILVIISTIGSVLGSTVVEKASQRDNIYVDATTTFTIENPPVDFEVIDADPFDGFGDNGPYSTFNDALLGTLGECRSMAEFDISPFSIPPGEFISMATFEVIITAIDIYGLGVNGETPESLTVDGYVGNGLEELTDFEAGDGNVLDSVDTPDPQIGQVLSFDVTSFVTDLVNAQEQYVGLTIRAETFGGLWVTEGGVFPKLTIETIPEPEPDLGCDGSLGWDDVKPGATVTGQFAVGNMGEIGSLLNWKVDSWPSWGTWTFTPNEGTGLAKGDWTTITVTVIAPDEKKKEFDGNVTLVNIDDPSDYCIIPVSLTTPLKQNLYFQPFFERLFERFSNAFPILWHILRY
jgi:hypothetical protein